MSAQTETMHDENTPEPPTDEPPVGEPPAPWPGAPRYAPELPFPAYRFVSGLHPHPRRDPDGSLFGAPEYAPGLPPEHWAQDTSFLFGVDLYHAGYLWEAHEAWEAVFFSEPTPIQKELIQALIQLAAALLTAHLGRTGGVRFLAGRVVEKLDSVCWAVPEGQRYCGLDVWELRTAVRTHLRAALGSDDSAYRPDGPAPRLHLRA
jgi:hypothetical protein